MAFGHADYYGPSPDIRVESGQGQRCMTSRRRNPGAAVALSCKDFWMAAEVKVVGSAEPLSR